MEVFVPQEHAPGAEAEVYFGEVRVVLSGVKTECHMFVFRLFHSGKAIHRIVDRSSDGACEKVKGPTTCFPISAGQINPHRKETTRVFTIPRNLMAWATPRE